MNNYASGLLKLIDEYCESIWQNGYNAGLAAAAHTRISTETDSLATPFGAGYEVILLADNSPAVIVGWSNDTSTCDILDIYGKVYTEVNDSCFKSSHKEYPELFHLCDKREKTDDEIIRIGDIIVPDNEFGSDYTPIVVTHVYENENMVDGIYIDITGGIANINIDDIKKTGERCPDVEGFILMRRWKYLANR